MSRPPGTKATTTRQRILDAALGLFATHGFDGATVRAIGAAAGVTVATIALHFHHKQGLHDACVAEVYRRLLAGAQSVLPPLAAHDHRGVLERAYDVAYQERDGVRILLRQVLDHGRFTPSTEQHHFLPGIERLAQVIAEELSLTTRAARTTAVSLTFLLARFAVQQRESLAVDLGVASPEEARGAVIDALLAVLEGSRGVGDGRDDR
ncbi:MAG TPA: TetR/AcrR family transcriptional regulator [Polyangia bacterium]|jgi:AcrR family transcriptional regulator